jgi:hypothetical protein
MDRQSASGKDANRLGGESSGFQVGDLVVIKNSLKILGVIVEVKGKIQGANHDWNKFYYMVLPAGSRYPTPVWNKELELVRRIK